MRHNKIINYIFYFKIKILIILCAIILQQNVANAVGVEVTPTSALQILTQDKDYLHVHECIYYASTTIGASIKVEASSTQNIKIAQGITVRGTLDGFHYKTTQSTQSAVPGLLITASSTGNLLSDVNIFGYISGSPALSIGDINKQNVTSGLSGIITNKGVIESSITAIYLGIDNPRTTVDENIKFINLKEGRIEGAIVVQPLKRANTSVFSLKNFGEIITPNIICQDLKAQKVFGYYSIENRGNITFANATTVASTLCVGRFINHKKITAKSKLRITGITELINYNDFDVNKEIIIDKDVIIKNLLDGVMIIKGSATFNNKTFNNGYVCTHKAATITAGATFINQSKGTFHSFNKLIINGSFTNSGSFIADGELIVNKTAKFINHKFSQVSVSSFVMNNTTIENNGYFASDKILGTGVINAQQGLIKIKNAITKSATIDIVNTSSVVELESFSTIQSYYGKGNNANELVINLPKNLPTASSALVNIIKEATFTTGSKIVLATDNPVLYIEKNRKSFTILQASTITVNTPKDLLYSRVYSRASNNDLNAQFKEALHSRTVLINITDVNITATKITADLQYTDFAIYQTDGTTTLARSLLNGRLAKATNIHPKLKKYNNTGIEASRKSDKHMDTILNVTYLDASISNQKRGIASGENSPFKIRGSVFFNYANEKQSKASDYKRKFYGNNIALGIEYQLPQVDFSFFALYSKTKFTNEDAKTNQKAPITQGSDETILDSYAAIFSIVKAINNFDIASSILYDRTKHHSGHFPNFFSNGYSLALIPKYKYDTGDNIINLGLASQLTLVQTPEHYNNNSKDKPIKKNNNTYVCFSPFVTVVESYKFTTYSVLTTEIKAGYLYIKDITNNKKDEKIEMKGSENSFMLDVQHQHIKHKVYVGFAANVASNNFFYGLGFRWKHDSKTNILDIKASVAYKL